MGFITGHRTKYLVIAFWLVIIAVTAGASGKLSGVEKNDVKSSLPNSAESTQVFNIQSIFGSPYTLPAVVVYHRSSGLTAADKSKVAADAATFSKLSNLDGKITGPTISKDGTAAQISVPLNLGKNYFNKVGDAVTNLRKTADHSAGGLTVEVSGPAGFEADLNKAVSGIDTTLLMATLIVVIGILLLTYRSPVLWLMPIISAGVSLSIAQAFIYLLAKHGLTVSADGAGILLILVFGATTDYSLLLIARYREELRRHEDRHEAMAIALRRSGPAIIASASTVAAGMLCLMLADMNSTKGLGPVFAIGIVIGALVMLTLFPALMVTVGRWIFWPSKPKYDPQEADAVIGRRWAKVGAGIARRPRITWVVCAVALAATALGIFQLNPNGLTDKQQFTTSQSSVRGEKILADHFEAGVGSPLVVTSDASGAAAVHQALVGLPGIAPGSLTQPVVKGDHAMIEGTLTHLPNSNAAFQTVAKARDAVHAVSGAHAQVGGDSAINYDVKISTKRDRDLIAPVVLLVVFLILVLLLRALVAPLLLLATVALSFGATLGVSALVFKHIMNLPAQDNTFPLYVFVFLIALGVDYNIFLMTRVREEALKHGTAKAAVRGLSTTGGVISSAGLVLAGTFAVFGTLPLTYTAQLGFSVAFGILLDTFIVRSMMVTALNLDVDRHIWWPSALFHKKDAVTG